LATFGVVVFQQQIRRELRLYFGRINVPDATPSLKSKSNKKIMVMTTNDNAFVDLFKRKKTI
jgi:hypothetical protein